MPENFRTMVAHTYVWHNAENLFSWPGLRKVPFILWAPTYGYLKHYVIFNDFVMKYLGNFSWPNVVGNNNGYCKNASSQTSEQH